MEIVRGHGQVVTGGYSTYYQPAGIETEFTLSSHGKLRRSIISKSYSKSKGLPVV